MSYIIVGLGNPGKEHKKNRHNTGRALLGLVREMYNFPEWRRDGKLHALVSEGVIRGEEVILLAPEAYMNNSGVSLRSFVHSEESAGKLAGKLIVMHDDLDLPIGSLKISFNRSSGGNNGVESVIKEIRTKSFIRIRVGISPTTFFGKMRKSRNNEYVLKNFTHGEAKKINKLALKISKMIESIITKGVKNAMNIWNSK